MKIFDLHCDTATELYLKKLSFDNSVTHLNAGTTAGHEVTQCFAIFLPDGKENRDPHGFYREVARTVPRLKRPGLTPLLTVEGAGVLATDPQWMDLLSETGCRMAGLVWNGKNPLATGAVTDDKAGLTDLGKDAVLRLLARGIEIDVSHLSARGTEEILTLTEAPIVASHSNLRTVWDHPRNLTAEAAKEIFRRGGLVGLNLYPPFLGEAPVSPEALTAHAEGLLALGGARGLALGCDLDGVDCLPVGIRDFGSLPMIFKRFEAAFGTEIAEGIFYKNAERFFGRRP